MTTRFAINGLGRIGRALLRIAHGHPDLELVAINDLAPAAELAPLVARDSVHGRLGATVTVDRTNADERLVGERLVIDGRPIPVTQAAEPREIPWPETARIVVEATGTATERSRAAGHLGGGVDKVVISALSPDADVTLCRGLNDDAYDPKRHHVISNASCTTHCLAPLVTVLDDAFGLRHGLMNEVHGYTSNQRLVDGPHPDPRRARAAAANIIPTTSAAPRAVERLLPHLTGRLKGQAVRVPTPNVALMEWVATVERPADTESVNAAFRRAAAGKLRNVLAVSDDPLVSSDHVGQPYSAIVDSLLTECVGGELVRVMAWYDNEWGYACRLADLLTSIGELLP